MQKHIQRYPSCPYVCGQIAGVNLMPPTLDDDHATICLMKRVDEVIKKVSLLSCHYMQSMSDQFLNLAKISIKSDCIIDVFRLLKQIYNWRHDNQVQK